MPSFESDLDQEKILSEYLDNIYKQKEISFYRIFDLDKQLQGIDLVMTVKEKEYFIDEKAQLHYINSDLPTFTFELSYLKDKTHKDGWLFEETKLTQYYFLITGIFLNEGKTELSSASDIEKVKITSVNRRKLIEFLSSRNLKMEKLLEYDSNIRENQTFGRNNIPELNPKSEGLIYFTEHLAEKPINIQLRLDFLIKNKVAKKFYYGMRER